MINYFKLYFLSEEAITIEFGQEISEEILKRISNFKSLLLSQPFLGFKTSVPAYCTLTVFYDPIVIINSSLPGLTCFDKVSNYLKKLTEKQTTDGLQIENCITIPVCYGAELGPDLEEVARLNNLSTEEVIQLHSSITYKVYMIGFVPGFAYLGGMNEKLASPRKDQPRASIPAGSVGIAGKQTGIYPLDTPGGWQIIGRSPLKLFDSSKAQPSLLQAGDQVIFKPITKQEFRSLSGN